MEIRLPRGKGPTVTMLGAVALGAFLAGAGPQLPGLLDRPACGEKVMQAVATEKPVNGSYACFDTNLQAGLSSAGIDSDVAFAARIGHAGSSTTCKRPRTAATCTSTTGRSRDTTRSRPRSRR